MRWARFGVNLVVLCGHTEGEAPTLATKKNGSFDPDTFLATIGDGRKILVVPKRGLLCAKRQGETHGRFQDRQGSNHRDSQ
jgi:hypothetical protein